ncbi:hypothetical protein RMATCC62417_01965 [Rhizopus microsporus]|nr:hypothetical protein RMATCC62417_01965 [Rhizopus microsporus]
MPSLFKPFPLNLSSRLKQHIQAMPFILRINYDDGTTKDIIHLKIPNILLPCYWRIKKFFGFHQEIEVCVAEAADDDNLINDHCKLLREGKDILDCLLETVVEKGATDKGKSLFIQLDCTQCQLSSIHLGDEANVYIAIPKQRLLLPTSAASIRRFEPTSAALLQLRRELSKLAMVIQQQ